MQCDTEIALPSNINIPIDSDSYSTTINGNIKTVRIPTITTIVSEIECTGPPYGSVERYDPITHAVPPNNTSDVLVLTSGVVKESGEMFFQRSARTELWFIYISTTVLTILFLASSLSGVNSNWYKQIKKSNVNPYIIGTLWVIATVLSYTAIFMIWEHSKPNEIPLDFRLSVFFLIGSFMSLLWTTILFQGNNIALALWVSIIMFLYQFWLFIYIWLIKPRAALFMIPIIIMYGYLAYSMLHLLTINNIIV